MNRYLYPIVINWYKYKTPDTYYFTFPTTWQLELAQKLLLRNRQNFIGNVFKRDTYLLFQLFFKLILPWSVLLLVENWIVGYVTEVASPLSRSKNSISTRLSDTSDIFLHVPLSLPLFVSNTKGPAHSHPNERFVTETQYERPNSGANIVTEWTWTSSFTYCYFRSNMFI